MGSVVKTNSFVLLALTVSLTWARPAIAQNTDLDSGTTTVQLSSGVSAGDAPSEQTTKLDLPQIPSFFGRQGSSLIVPTELQRSNYLRAGLNVSSAYNTNALPGPTGQVGNTQVSIFPNIAVNHTTPRMEFAMAYGAGFTLNHPLSSNNQVSHDFNMDSVFRLSPHVTVHAVENFSLTSGFFGATPVTPLQSGVAGPNATLITPLATEKSLQATADITYQYSMKDVVGASGSFYGLNYSDISTGPGSLSNTRTGAASFIWLHELFHGSWAGVSYRYQGIDAGANGNTSAQTVAFVDTISITKTLHLIGFIGPEYSSSELSAAAASVAGWRASGGVEMGWQKGRNGVTAGYVKRISDGAGIVGAVTLQNLHAAASRQLSPTWTASVSANYGANNALTSAGGASDIHTTSVGITLGRAAGRNLGFQFGYFRDMQDQSGSATSSQNFNANQNRVFLSLAYEWTRPLGR